MRAHPRPPRREMHEMRSWRPRVVVLVALALGGGGCIGRSDSGTENPTEVRIGLIAATTGDNKGAGIEAQRGAQLAADVVNGLNSLIPLPLANDAGLTNLGNARIRIVTKDVGSEPGKAGPAAANAVTSMVASQGVAAIVGGYDADVTVKASQRAERIPVPFVNADSSVSFLTERGLDWFFRLGPSARTSGEAFFSLLKQAASQKKATKKIAIMHATDKAGTDVDAVITEEAASTFTAVLTLAIAINNAGSTDAKRIRSALLNLDIPGKDTIMPWEGIQFDETHQNSGAASVVEQFIDKAFRVVFPIDAAAGDKQFVYPAPGAPSGVPPVG